MEIKNICIYIYARDACNSSHSHSKWRKFGFVEFGICTYLKYGTVRFSVDLEWVISWDIRLDLGCNKQSKTTAVNLHANCVRKCLK